MRAGSSKVGATLHQHGEKIPGDRHPCVREFKKNQKTVLQEYTVYSMNSQDILLDDVELDVLVM